jgi:hypothetical protein
MNTMTFPGFIAEAAIFKANEQRMSRVGGQHVAERRLMPCNQIPSVFI